MILEHLIEIEENIEPINAVLDRIKEYLKEELQTRSIFEYTQSLDERVLIHCRIYFQGFYFKIQLFDGIVIGELKMTHDDVMTQDTLKNALHKLIDAYLEERNRLSDELLRPCYSYYKMRIKATLKEEF